MVVVRAGNSGGTWEPSSQKEFGLAESQKSQGPSETPAWLGLKVCGGWCGVWVLSEYYV